MAYTVKKRVTIFLGILLLTIPAVSVNGETVTEFATMQAGANDVFSLELASPATEPDILYSTNIPFTNIDPTKLRCFSDGRSTNQSKSDTGVLCKSNRDVVWFLKMTAQSVSSPPFPLSNFKFYMDQPWNKTLNQTADGYLNQPVGWTGVPASPTLVYTAGDTDMNNLDGGTLVKISFAVEPAGIIGGNYSIDITYSLSENP